jgi:hypothetical protein
MLAQCSPGKTRNRLAEFRHSLLAASRVYPNPEFEPLMNQASDADLEWLIVRIDEIPTRSEHHDDWHHGCDGAAGT